MTRSKTSFELGIFKLYIILRPLYILNDSPIQIADLILLFGFLCDWVNPINVDQNRSNLINIVPTYFAIALYQLFVNIVTFLFVRNETIESFSLIKNNFYYIFNLFAIVYVYHQYYKHKENVFYTFADGSFYSMLVILIGLILNLGKTSRNASFFSNPNQLGYYVLIVFTSIILLKNFYSYTQKVIIVIITALSLLMSGSKGAIIGCLILCSLETLRILIKKTIDKSLRIDMRKFFTVICISIIGIFVIGKYKETLGAYYNSFLIRLDQSLDSGVNLGSSRGYDRIAEMGSNFFWGCGEGAFYRFNVMRGNETHSSFATIIVSYGLIGALMYLRLFLIVLKKQMKLVRKYTVIFSGILFYWVSHNGLRNTLFWIILIFVIFLEDKHDTEEQPKTMSTK